MDKITKLSQAIRLGATFREQCHGRLFMNDKSCAIGAAIEAVFPDAYSGAKVYQNYNDYYARLPDRFPVLDKTIRPPKCLKKGTFSSDCRSIIMRLNDHCHWSREEIAYWLETQGY